MVAILAALAAISSWSTGETLVTAALINVIEGYTASPASLTKQKQSKPLHNVVRCILFHPDCGQNGVHSLSVARTAGP